MRRMTSRVRNCCASRREYGPRIPRSGSLSHLSRGIFVMKLYVQEESRVFRIENNVSQVLRVEVDRFVWPSMKVQLADTKFVPRTIVPLLISGGSRFLRFESPHSHGKALGDFRLTHTLRPLIFTPRPSIAAMRGPASRARLESHRNLAYQSPYRGQPPSPGGRPRRYIPMEISRVNPENTRTQYARGRA